MDISDGLLATWATVLQRSKVGARIEATLATPLLAAAQQGLSLQAEQQLDLVLAGGDDYELAFTAPPQQREAVLHAAMTSHTPVTRIGAIEAEPGLRVLDAQGREITRAFDSFDHFA